MMLTDAFGTHTRSKVDTKRKMFCSCVEQDAHNMCLVSSPERERKSQTHMEVTEREIESVDNRHCRATIKTKEKLSFIVFIHGLATHLSLSDPFIRNGPTVYDYA